MPRSDAIKTIQRLSEGNPGAAIALGQVYRNLGENHFSTLVQKLRQLGYTGPEIHLCYTEYAEQDLYKFFEGVRTQDPAMVSIINLRTRRA